MGDRLDQIDVFYHITVVKVVVAIRIRVGKLLDAVRNPDMGMPSGVTVLP